MRDLLEITIPYAVLFAAVGVVAFVVGGA